MLDPSTSSQSLATEVDKSLNRILLAPYMEQVIQDIVVECVHKSLRKVVRELLTSDIETQIKRYYW